MSTTHDLPILRGAQVTLRPWTEADIEPFARMVEDQAIGRWWPESGDPERLRDGLRDDFENDSEHSFAIELDGELVGWLLVTEETYEDYPRAEFDLSVSGDHQGKGLGPDALRTVIRWLIDEHGHHRFLIEPAAANERAIKAYASVGFKPVGIVRQAERDIDGGWRDALLMDLLAEELT